MNSCAVIIVNYNTGKLLSQVIKRVLKAQGVDEIIIVDNNSTDNSMELTPKSVKIKTYYRKQNKGFASSCNYGAKHSSADFLLFLNPDCLIEKSSITHSIETFKENKNPAIVGVRVNNPDGTEQRATRRRLPTLWRAIKTYLRLEKAAKFCDCFAGVNLNYKPMPTSIQSVEAISGAFILIKTSVFKQISGFDESFFLHFEDLDLFKRTLDKGYEILFNPTIQVIHYQGTSSQSNPTVGEYKKQSLRKYFHKHCSFFAYSTMRFVSRFL